MALNLPSGTTNDISFGPATLKMALFTGSGTSPNGLTPTVDVGFIGDDGVSLEMVSEKKQIMQGNPRQVVYTFQQQQMVNITFTSIEWDFLRFKMALGSGINDEDELLYGAGSSEPPGWDIPALATGEAFWFGGDPTNVDISMSIRHQMGVTGDTLNCYVWKCQSTTGFTAPFGQDEHSFGFGFTALGVTKSWDGLALSDHQSLIRIDRYTKI
ncbi:MAG TPA: hypothetical protein EYN67_03875 [Flavobacteriales bacterium]|nr:hypothetical protein [Flavobacteriales bacterium]